MVCSFGSHSLKCVSSVGNPNPILCEASGVTLRRREQPVTLVPNGHTFCANGTPECDTLRMNLDYRCHYPDLGYILRS